VAISHGFAVTGPPVRHGAPSGLLVKVHALLVSMLPGTPT
jgi:hypothetical protein